MRHRSSLRRFRTLPLLAIAALAFAAAACGDDDDDDATPAATSTPIVSPTGDGGSPTPRPGGGSPTATAPADEFEGSTEPVASDGTVDGIVLLVDVRAARQEGFDRAVWEFDEGIPPYTIEYVEPPILADGSGMEVEIEGEAFLVVRFETTNAHTEAGQPTIDDREIGADLPAIVELEQTGDFEAIVTWALGLRDRLDFRVTELDDPPRVVIDVAHP